MFPFFKPNIRSKLLIIVLLSLSIGLTSVGTALYYRFQNYLNIQVHNILQQYVDLAEASLDPQMLAAGNTVYLKEFVDRSSRIVGCRFTLINPSGVVLADSEIPIADLATVENHLYRPEVQRSLESTYGTDSRFSNTINIELQYMSKALRPDGALIGFIRVALFARQTRELLQVVRIYSIIGGALILLICTLLLIIFTRRIDRNLEEVINKSRLMAGGDLAAKIGIESQDELGQLGTALNEMASRLSSNMQRLSREREDLDMVLSSIKEGIIAIDEEEKIILFNEIGLNMLKKPQTGNIHGIRYDSVIQNPHLIALIQNFFKRPYLVTDELETEAGPVIEVVINPFNIKNRNRRGAVVVLRDITQFKKLEKIRRDFVANVSHEFKTPLSAIRGYAESLLDWALEDERTNRKYVNKIVKQSVQLENLVMDLLQLARIERLQNIELKAFNPNPVVHDVINQYFEMAEGKNIELSTQLYNKPFKIHGDPEMFRSIIANLIDNAIKYTPFDGKVVITSSISERNAYIAVEDNGPGIPAKYRERIFERFYRVDKSRSSATAGTGLGLSIVKHLAELQRGEVELRSQINKGSCFSLKFKLARG